MVILLSSHLQQPKLLKQVNCADFCKIFTPSVLKYFFILTTATAVIQRAKYAHTHAYVITLQWRNSKWHTIIFICQIKLKQSHMHIYVHIRMSVLYSGNGACQHFRQKINAKRQSRSDFGVCVCAWPHIIGFVCMFAFKTFSNLFCVFTKRPVQTLWQFIE